MTTAGPGGVVAVPAWRASVAIFAATLALAVAIWLWPASVHIVAWPRSGAQRIAVFAPLYWLMLLIAGAVVVAGFIHLLAGRLAQRLSQRHPHPLQHFARVLTPLNLLWVWTLPYWPWLPDRWPLLVASAGPLRWVLAGLAIAGVVGRSVAGPEVVGPDRPLPGRWTAGVVALVLYLFLGVHAVTTTGLGGDEPHYLVITQSLLADGDIRIENNHRDGSYRAFFNGELRPDYLERGQNGEIYSIHAPGLSVLLLPGFALARGLGAVITMCVLSALAMMAVFEMAALMAGPLVGWLVWLAVAVTVPFVPHAWALYPEMAGAAIVAWAMLWLLREDDASPQAWAWRGVCLACLPWLHTKFSVFLAGLALLALWRLWWPRRRWAALVAVLTPIAVSGVAWLAFFYIVYGKLDPQAPYGGYTAQFVRFENLPRSILGLLVDQKFGLLVYAPIYALVIPGWWAVRHDVRRRGLVLGAGLLALAYVVSSARLYMWWGGSSAPARFLVPVAPLLAPALALAIARVRGRAATTVWALAAGISLLAGLSGALGAGRFLLFSDPHGVARVLDLAQGSAPLTAALPTFTQEEWVGPLRQLLPWLAALGLGLAAGALVAKRTRSAIWIGAADILVFGLVGAATVTTFPAAVRIESVTRGSMALLEAYDPVRLRAFDYPTLTRLSPPAWLEKLAVSFDREPGGEPDPLGRVSGSLQLPPGEYEARVWFEGNRPRTGALQAALGNDYLLARVEEPLSNPAVLPMSVPLAVPSVWIQLTDLASARSVRRLDIVPRDVVPVGDRSHEPVLAVEGFDGRLNAYAAYVNDEAFPERGTFWTRAGGTARVLVAPAGASAMVVTMHVGPLPSSVSVRVGDHVESIAFARDETRTIRVPIAPGARVVPVEVRSSAFFRPHEVDPSSSDTRELGCQVRLVLE